MGFGNVNAWKTLTEGAKSRVKAKATKYVQDKAYKVLLEAVKISPQFSGTFAANWVIEITGNPARFYTYPSLPKGKHTSDRFQGDMSNMASPLAFSKDIISQAKWNSNLRLVNLTPADEGGLLISQLDGPKYDLRPVNPIGKYVGVKVYLRQKFKFIS